MSIQAQLNEQSMNELFTFHPDLKAFIAAQDDHHKNQLRCLLINEMCCSGLLVDNVVERDKGFEEWLKTVDYRFKKSAGYVCWSQFWAEGSGEEFSGDTSIGYVYA